MVDTQILNLIAQVRPLSPDLRSIGKLANPSGLGPESSSSSLDTPIKNLPRRKLGFFRKCFARKDLGKARPARPVVSPYVATR